MDFDSPPFRRELLATLSVARQTPAASDVNRARRSVGRSPSDDPMADAVRAGLTGSRQTVSGLNVESSDADAAAALAALSVIDRAVLVLHHGRSWADERIERAVGVEDARAAIRVAEAAVGPALQQRVAWEIDNQLRNVDVSEKDHGRRRIGIGFGVAAIAAVAILGFLAFAQRSINRPDLIQLRPTGLLRVSTSGDTTRLIEEQVAVAVVSPDNKVLYQLSGGPGVPGGSIWYSPGPGQRAGQVIAKTGGILGWVAAEDLPPAISEQRPHGVAIVAETAFDAGVVTTTYQIVLVEPDSRSVAVIDELGTSTGDGERSNGGTAPVHASYGGGRILVWMMDAVTLEGLPSDQAADCGDWMIMDLTATAISTAGLPAPACDQNATSLSVPTLSPDGSRVLWLETNGVVDGAAPALEGWLSSQKTVLHSVDLDSGRQLSVSLTDVKQPTFWTQYTMFSQQTGTLTIDSEGDIAIVSIGVWNPEVATFNYSTYLVDLISERVEVSVGDGPATFGR